MQGNDSFRLVVRRGPQPNQTYDLNKDIITVGRDITNDITINDPEVSRHHMRFTRGAGGFTLEDLGSTNGTFVNGQRLTGAKPLSNGDMIGLGETVTLGYEMVRPMMAGDPMGGVAPEPQTVANPVARQQPMPQQQQPMQPGVAPVAPGSPGVYDYNPSQPYSPAAAPGVPAGANYDYDPYAVREEEQRNTVRWVLIGCVAISLFCCCATVAGLFLVDALNLWCRIPLLYPILNQFGFYAAGC
jgi:pSer/pThr/pTyr-binding forkhead associated (FHA) protein